MNELLHHAIGVLLALPTWLAPLIFLPIARAQLELGGTQRLWRAWFATVLAFAAFVTLGWYVYPDGAGSPLPGVAGELVLIVPSLAVTAYVLQETRGSSLTERNRLAIAGIAGMAVLLVCFLPAAGISAALGGSEVGSDPC